MVHGKMQSEMVHGKMQSEMVHGKMQSEMVHGKMQSEMVHGKMQSECSLRWFMVPGKMQSEVVPGKKYTNFLSPGKTKKSCNFTVDSLLSPELHGFQDSGTAIGIFFQVSLWASNQKLV
jgi:hypothetical protein